MSNLLDEMCIKLGIDSKDFEIKTIRVNNLIRNTTGLANKLGKTLNSLTGNINNAPVTEKLTVTLKHVSKKAKEAEAGMKKASEATERMTIGVVKLGGALGYISKAKGIAEQILTTNTELYFFSKNIGEGVTQLSALGNMAEQVGGKSEELRKTLGLISRSQTELQLTGDAPLLKYLNMLQVSLFDTDGKARKALDVLFDIASSLEKIGGIKAFNIATMMGLDDSTIKLMTDGRLTLSQFVSELEHGNTINQKQGEDAIKLNIALEKLKQNYWGLNNIIRPRPLKALVVV